MYYKYLPIDRTTYLSDELIRFTQPGDLNDPFECLPQKPDKKDMKLLVIEAAKILSKSEEAKMIDEDKFIEIIEKQINNIEQGNEDSLLDKFFNSAKSNTNEKIGILSLSKNWNSTLMWSHYTQSHKGFCIGFEPSHPFFKDYSIPEEKKSFFTKEVKYSRERVKVPMKFGEKKLVFEPFITKSSDWEYEEEIRVLATLDLAVEVIPRETFPLHLFKVPHSAIKEIILGANISNVKAKEITAFCIQKKIKCFQSKISNIKYDMERDEI